MKTSIVSCLILVCCLNFSVFGGTIDPSTQDSEYISYGKHFKYVAYIHGHYGLNSSFIGSAVAIDDHNIITAAHILHKAKSCYVEFDNGNKFQIDKIIIPKEFELSKRGFADIAIGYSKKPFNLDFYPPLYSGSDELHKVCCISGYGFAGNFIDGANKFDRKKRGGSNIVETIHDDLLICNPSDKLSATRTSLEFLISSGDSGGGLFIDGKLAGINSCIISNNSDSESCYDDISGHTRISKFLDWIQQHKIKKLP